MNEIEALRKTLNNHISLDNNNLSSEETLTISRLLDKMMLDMYTAFGEPIVSGDKYT